MNVVWYVSAHGLGHAARERELIRALLENRDDVEITVVTGVPIWFWGGSAKIEYRPWTVGLNPIESDGTTDMEASRRALIDYCGLIGRILRRETAFLGKRSPDLVISDIDPAPIAASSILDIPCWGIGNFSWDWIFSKMFPDLEDEPKLLAELYSGGRYMRLPMSPEEHPFQECIDVPLVPGGVIRNPDGARSLLGEGRTLLVALRDPARLSGPVRGPKGWRTVTALPDNRFGADLNLPPEVLDKAGIGFPDLAAAADVVLMKPGYGMVSLLQSLGGRAIVVGRGQFPEVPYLLRPLVDRPGTILAEADEIEADLAGMLTRIAAMERPDPVPADGIPTILGDAHLLNLI